MAPGRGAPTDPAMRGGGGKDQGALYYCEKNVALGSTSADHLTRIQTYTVHVPNYRYVLLIVDYAAMASAFSDVVAALIASF